MKAVNVMFDTLCRDFLSPYGNNWIKTPNFDRLAEKACRYDQCYGGSMPCMPARRELHTGRYNFVHRSWGPLEPFDFSVQDELNRNGIYTHIVTDHSHYWEDGGGTYHNRYTTWEGFRGQEGDRWMPQDYGIVPEGRSELNKPAKNISVKQHYANISAWNGEEDMSCVQTFRAGEEFIRRHQDKDNWFLQIESFDPHEPFTVPDRYRKMYDLEGMQKLDWPAYGPVDTALHQDDLDEMRREYAALVTMCDHYLGEVLDLFDEYNLWKDTALIVNTDHGFLLGEHEFLGKNFPPMYQELIHLPFFMYVPGKEKAVSDQLIQTVDFAPTLLDLFGIECHEDFDGISLCTDGPVHDYAIFGVHGGSIGITDGHFKYFRANVNEDNSPFVECTLMPTNMRGFFKPEFLKKAELVPGDRFSHGIPYLKVPAKTYLNARMFGDLLFDLDNDPKEEKNLLPSEKETEFRQAIHDIFTRIDAPREEFERLGL